MRRYICRTAGSATTVMYHCAALILVLGPVEIKQKRSILTHAAAEKMIKSPRNIKYTKYQKNYTHSRGTPAKRNTSVDFGTYGLQCNEPTLLSLKQLETCRRTLRRVVARRAPIWIRAFPYKPLYKKEQGQRIGTGKGDRSEWVCPVRKGQIILEVGGQVDISVVRKVFSTISYQLGVPTKLVKKNGVV